LEPPRRAGSIFAFDWLAGAIYTSGVSAIVLLKLSGQLSHTSGAIAGGRLSIILIRADNRMAGGRGYECTGGINILKLDVKQGPSISSTWCIHKYQYIHYFNLTLGDLLEV
jgi:hypothetical protein